MICDIISRTNRSSPFLRRAVLRTVAREWCQLVSDDTNSTFWHFEVELMLADTSRHLFADTWPINTKSVPWFGQLVQSSLLSDDSWLDSHQLISLAFRDQESHPLFRDEG